MQIGKIKTKFNVDDVIYVLHKNECKKCRIYMIEINIQIVMNDIIYEIYYKLCDKNGLTIGTFTEDLLYENELDLMVG